MIKKVKAWLNKIDFNFVWWFGSYQLGWYKDKIIKYIPIHLIIGFVAASLVGMPVFFIYGSIHIAIKICAVIAALFIGGGIEYTQMRAENFDIRSKLSREAHLLGHIRDIITYGIVAAAIFFF